MCIAAIVFAILSIYQEKIARKYSKISTTPEGLLCFSCIESALLPIGLFWFGKINIASKPEFSISFSPDLRGIEI